MQATMSLYVDIPCSHVKLHLLDITCDPCGWQMICICYKWVPDPPNKRSSRSHHAPCTQEGHFCSALENPRRSFQAWCWLWAPPKMMADNKGGIRKILHHSTGSPDRVYRSDVCKTALPAFVGYFHRWGRSGLLQDVTAWRPLLLWAPSLPGWVTRGYYALPHT